jgi:indolepyruvate ferredoxin oxidoreductase
MDVPALTRSLAADGVRAITVCTDDVHRYGRGAAFAAGVTVRSRDDVVAAQDELRAHPGVSVLIYDQRCTAEARRLRKRGLLDDPPTRVVINQAVCEGCGHCSEVSNCLSVLPTDTEFGERREIHQSSCNKDYSCLEGDCPSFLTFVPTTRRSRFWRRAERDDVLPAARTKGLPEGELPLPEVAPLEGRFSVYTTGIGGTGIVTANRLLAHAAAIAGYTTQGVDQTGLSQKAGAVVSHLHIAPSGADITTATVAEGDADLYLSGDILQAASAPHLRRVARGRTYAVVDTDFVPTASMLQGNGSVDPSRLAATLVDAIGPERTLLVDSTSLAERIFGSHLPANVLLLGAAFQLGALPLPLDAIERAITEEGPAADLNRAAFGWGRWVAADPAAVETRLQEGSGTGARGSQAALWEPSARSTALAAGLVEHLEVPAELRTLLERRAAQVVDYQGVALARRWLGLVEQASAVDDERACALTEAVAEGWFKLLTYKDEYEVARLHLRLDLDEVAAELGFGAGYRARYMLHPPTLRRLGLDRKIGLGRSGRVAFRGLAALRRVRGTPLDLFGYARHRREERQVADEYAQLMTTALAGLTPDTYSAALDLARSVATIRGYEDIKSAAIARWRTETADLRAEVGAAT